MKRFVILFFMFFIHNAFAECVSVDTVTKCARFPTCVGFCYRDGSRPTYTNNVAESDGVSWSYLRDGIPYSGTSQDLYIDKVSAQATCLITSPVLASVTGWGALFNLQAPTGANVCAFPDVWELSQSDFVVTQLEGDICPDGFYTVPYETSCGTGLVNIANVPNCSDDTSGEYCLIPAGTPCAAISDCGEISYTNSNGLYTLSYTACDAGMCADDATTLTACGNGYYGDGTSCTPCPTGGVSDTPTWSEQSDGTIAFDVVADAMTDCYVEPDTYFTDEKGTYRFRENCTYKD